MLPGGQLLASGDETGELAVKDLRMLGQSSSAASKQTVWSQKGGYGSGLASGISCLAIGPKPSGVAFVRHLMHKLALWSDLPCMTSREPISTKSGSGHALLGHQVRVAGCRPSCICEGSSCIQKSYYKRCQSAPASMDIMSKRLNLPSGLLTCKLHWIERGSNGFFRPVWSASCMHAAMFAPLRSLLP